MKTYHLTQSQLGMFLDWDREHDSTQYTLAIVNVFPKTIDAERLVRAIEEAVAANEVFRMRFVQEDDEVRWTVDDGLVIKVGRGEMSDAEADVRQHDFARGFDAFKGPFARFELIETPTTYRLFSEVFHLISDGSAFRIFLQEVKARYEGEKGSGNGDQESEGSFAAYAEAEAKSFETAEYAAAKTDAAARFGGRAMTVPEKGSGIGDEGLGIRDQGIAGKFHRCEVAMPRSAIEAYCRAHSLHPNLFFMGVFARTLALFANERDVVFMTANHGRGKDAALRMCCGCFVKTVPVLGEMKGDATCLDYFRSFKLHGAGVYPFTHFCRDLGFNPGWMFVYQDGTVDLSLTLEGVSSVASRPMSDGAGELPGVEVYGAENDFRIEMACAPGRYDAGFLGRFLGRMKVIAENFLAAGAETPLKAVPLLTADELAAVMKMSYGGDLEYDRETTFLDLFHSSVHSRASATAVVAGERSLTYGELDERSDALASYLVGRGVKPGEFVGVKLPRCVDFIVAVLGVQKCGAGYIPIDPEYPQDRVDYMISDSGARLVVDERVLEAADVESRPDLALPLATPASPAYMIYTSGSTGRPKGVAVPHRALRNMLAWVIRDYGIEPGMAIATHPSFSFDASVIDIFPALAAGAELHILVEEIRKDIAAIRDYIVENRVKGLTMSTQIGMALIDTYPEVPLDYIQVGGEKLVPVSKTEVRIINGYGPTEFCVCSSYENVDQEKDGDIPIGRPVPNTYSLIVDKLGALVPRGMAGEIALQGVQLSDGYWHQPEKTAKAFVDGRYLTGDLARYNAEDKLEYLGRLDFQVKLRGFRIEIGEIESVAKTFPGVKSVIAMVKKVAGVDHLVLYYEKAGSGPVETESLREHLAAKLTPYMVPDYFVEMEKMPLTPVGKIDRRALPDPEEQHEPVVEPANDTERRILSVISDVLKRDDFGVTHDFGRLGLTSLGAIKMMANLKRTLGVKVSMRQLADNPSVRQLAELVAPSDPKAASSAGGSLSSAPMTENQRGIYVDWLLNPDTTQYNIPAAIRFPDLDPERLAAAAGRVLAAHSSFRVHFVERDGEMVQETTDAKGMAKSVEVEWLEAEPEAEFFAKLVKPFGPKADSLVRTRVLAVKPNISYLFLDCHHTVFDGCSMGIFLKELMQALDGGEIAAETYSMLDAALAERKYLDSSEAEEDEKWFERYLDGLESTRVETSISGADGRPGECGKVARRVESQAISACCTRLGITASDYFLTTFTELLRRVGRSEDVLINFVTAGRTDPDVLDTIGMFVKTLPLRGVKDARTFGEASSRMHRDVLEIIDRERVSFARLSERFGVRPEIIFAFEGGIFDLPRGATVISTPLETAKAPLSVTVTPGRGDFELAFEYDRSLYSPADMEMLLGMFATLAGGFAAEGDPELRSVPLVSKEESEALLRMSYGGDLEYDGTKTFLNLFHANVLTRSFATAVVAGESSLTYGELDERSDALARYLVGRGVKPGEFVGVKLPRCAEFIVAVLGVQKCGAGYIPIDPEYPQERIDYIVADSGARLVVDEKELESAAGASAAGGDPDHPFSLAVPDSPAYMIYTSGSTGRPKGVVLPHRALRNLIAWVIREYGLGPESRIATHPSFSFDASVIDIFPALAAGAELHIYEEGIRKDIPAIRDYIIAHGITGGTMSTQIGMALLDSFPDLPLAYLQLGGEKLMPVAKTGVRIINGYGPTEFCVCSSYEIVDQERDGDIPIGRPVPNTYSLIVDRYGHLLPKGYAGEIALDGPQIADGYWHQPEKTAKAFVDGRYRTGDLARYNAENKLEYLGRLDFQVKLRGFRIEIGEIESVAKTFPGIGAVAAEVREVGGAKHLVLYYEKAGSGSVETEALRVHLASKLTSYMVPDYFVEVESMPMTPNGKINRKLLKSPAAEDSPREYVEPANDTERRIAAVYSEILGTGRFGATDDFFELGGTSLIAIKAVVALQKAGLEVQYGDLFKYKSPRTLSAFLTGDTQPLQSQPTSQAFQAFDYGAIDKLLANTRAELFEGFRRHSLGDVLLTGATGYLGIHVLRYLLEKTDSSVSVLVRSKKGVGPARRVDSQYVYYFGERVPKRFHDRLSFLEGDITDDLVKAGGDGEAWKVDTVINCAALVKHYVADDLMDRINVGGVENLIRFCEQSGARLIQTSTYSIGGTIRGDSMAGLDERHLYIGQDSDNAYVRTKFLAERAVLEAVATGRLRGKIMRLGNLMGRESDGEFQMNVGANAFINSLRTYRALGAYPLAELAKPLEMSPIDRVAEAICLLSTTPDDMCVFHPYNRYALDMGAVIAAMNSRGWEIDAVSAEDFAAHVDALRNDPAHATELQGILHYAGHLLEGRKMAPVDNTWTTTVLYRLGFRWKPAEDCYLANFFNMLDGIGVFE